MVKGSGNSGDRAAIEAVLLGDVDRFSEIIDRYKAKVAGLASRHVPPAQVPDVAQETFVRAFRSLAGFDLDRPLEPWLAAIAVRACHDYWRARYKNRETALSALPEGLRSWLREASEQRARAAFERENEKREAAEALAWALDRLGPTDRTVLTLTHLEGYTAAEAGAMLGLSAANVKIRSHRGRNMLRRLLRKAMEGSDEP
ncbi:MAG: sigma-70 family RNA polymerase sigma factor [Desulfovibrionaceae bacterium]|nr:sigma-70 family RNA polymerase sigma factor [Desulfovibrionaceae bacterium]